jgi:iron complex outermembrane recepter protein
MRTAFSIGGVCAFAAAGSLAQTTPAQAPSQLDPVVISAERSRQTTFEAPAAISAVTRETIESAGPGVNLSEVLNRVPGITVLNRQNYSQDLQLSIRGFGSRSTFGIRGVKLIVDGIPASMPDGQGQASNVALSSAGRIEVLRGPMAQLYGNAAGGVVQVFTEDDAAVPTVSLSGAAGTDGLFKVGAKFSMSTPGYGLTVDASQFQTDGSRPHSEAKRGQLNARLQTELTRDTGLSFVLNVLDQPESKDPLGLNADQFRNGAPGNAAYLAAIAQDPRKTVRQEQGGLVLSHRFSEATELQARLYAGQRNLDNALSVPIGAQTTDTSSGGIVEFARTYAGGAVQLAHRIALGQGRGARFIGGVEVERLREDRQGYLNTLGVRGALKRDELNRVTSRDVFAQAAYEFAPQLSATVGARRSIVKFSSADRFIIAPGAGAPGGPGNPDDSGSLSFQATNPVAGIAWKATPLLNVYANVGRGFETPTFNELSYRPAGTGLNTALKASRSRHAEVGTKWKYANGQRLDAALFDIATSDEIVVDTNTGGRATFKNAGATHRRGIEFMHLGTLSDSLRSTLSLTVMRARFDSNFISGTGTVPNVFSGYRLPGTPERSAFAELAWAPRGAWGGFNSGVEVVHTGKLYVNDLNTDAASEATVLNLRAGFEQTLGDWKFSQLLRVDNAADRTYAGSVIVNEGNSRFFEPAQGRNWLVALKARYEFR